MQEREADRLERVVRRPERHGEGDEHPTDDDDEAGDDGPRQPTGPWRQREGPAYRYRKICCGHDSRICGSATAYVRSVARLARRNAVPPRIVTPATAGQSSASAA